MELALPAVFLIIVYLVVFVGYSPFIDSKPSPRYIFDRAKVLTRRGKFSQALNYAQQLTRDFPTNHVYWAQEADLQRRLENFSGEAHALEQIIVHSSMPDEACPRVAQAYGDAGDKAKMLDAFKRCLNLSPNDADSHFYLGHAQEREGELDEALIEYQACLDRAPQYLDCSLGKARALLRQGDSAAAAEVVENLERNEVESSADALFVRALVRRRTGKLKLAIKDLRKAVELAPNYADVFKELVAMEKGVETR